MWRALGPRALKSGADDNVCVLTNGDNRSEHGFVIYGCTVPASVPELPLTFLYTYPGTAADTGHVVRITRTQFDLRRRKSRQLVTNRLRTEDKRLRPEKCAANAQIPEMKEILL